MSCEKCKFLIYHPYMPYCKCCAPSIRHKTYNYYKGRAESRCVDVVLPECKHFVKAGFFLRNMREAFYEKGDNLLGIKID